MTRPRRISETEDGMENVTGMKRFAEMIAPPSGS